MTTKIKRREHKFCQHPDSYNIYQSLATTASSRHKFIVMGPGDPRRRLGRYDTADGRYSHHNYKTCKPGDVPVYNDNMNPKVYRRRVNDWIGFMALADKSSSKSMTLGQQVFALITNVRGTAGSRLEYIGDRITPNLSEEDFYEIIDTILNTIDPIDRESQFMDTSKLWMQLMVTVHQNDQSFDDFWKYFNNIALRYTYQHGDVAKQRGVQELLALLCLQNAKLSRTEFTTTMESALRIQSEIDLNGKSSNIGVLSNYRSTKDTMSSYSRKTDNTAFNVGEAGPSRNVQDDSASSQMKAMSVKLIIDIDDQKDKIAALLESPSLAAGDKVKIQEIGKELKNISSEMGTLEKYITKANDGSSQKKPSITSDEKITSPIMTLDAIRIALRRIDHVEEAIRPSIQYKKDDYKRKSFKSLISNGKGKCWTCGGNHFAKDNPECMQKLMDKRKASASFQKGTGTAMTKMSTQNRGAVSTEPLSLEPWGHTSCDLSMKSVTKTTVDVTELDNTNHGEIIIDGGATATVSGLMQYSAYCELMGLDPSIQDLKPDEVKWHAFGTERNYSKPQKILGHANIPIPVSHEDCLYFKFKVIEGDVPMILGKDELRNADAIEAHKQDWIEVSCNNKRIKLQTKLNKNDGHARLVLSGLDMRMNMEQTTLENTSKEDDPKSMIKRIHTRTHFHPKSLELLLKRSKKWKPCMMHMIQEIQESCKTCRQTGDPEVSKKFNLNKLHKNFNNRVYMDIAYWGNKLILHMVDFATSYSEGWVIPSRKLSTILSTMERIWINKHGDFKELYVDQEFENAAMKSWCQERNIVLVPVPSRRHNKAGQVERKNRVLKDILEKLTHPAQKQDSNFNNTVSNAIFISNIMYGNRILSSFEMVRGFTPCLNGSGKHNVPTILLQAQKELQARRLFARVLKSRPLPKKKDEVKIGDKVLILIPGGTRKRGKWVEDTVYGIRNDGSLECGSGTNRKIIAEEDYRALPRNSISRKFIRRIENASTANTEESEDEYALDECCSEETDDSDAEPTTRLDQHSPTDDRIQCEDLNVPVVAPPATADHTPEIIDDNDTSNTITIPQNEMKSRNQQPNQPRRSSRIRRKPARYEMLTNNQVAVKQKYLAALYERTGGAQFLLHENPDIPEWIVQEARRKELSDNWEPHIDVVHRSSLPSNANVIGSHFVYKVKCQSEDREAPSMCKLKARLCVHGNHDNEKENIRSDAAVVSHFGFRLIYCMASVTGMVLAKIDIKGAYPRSGEAHRDIFVRPPSELRSAQEMFLLKSTMYGIVSAGRKWKRVSDNMLLNNMNMKALLGLPQFFYKEYNGKIVLLLAKYVDDLLIAGINQQWIEYAKTNLEQSFELSQYIITPNQLTVNSTEVQQTKEEITVTMTEFSRDLSCIMMSPLRRKQISDAASRLEIRRIRSIAGVLVYIGIALYPPALLISSWIQQSVPYLTVGTIKEINGVIRDMMKRERQLIFNAPDKDITASRIVLFSDAGYPHRTISRLRNTAQEACIAGLCYGERKGSIFHLLYYHARKQRRVSDSTFAAESIAAVSAYGVGLMIQDTFKSLLNVTLPITLVTDSSSLHKTCATESSPRDKSTLRDITKLRAAYDEGHLDKIVWIPGNFNPSDALTKTLSGTTAGILDELMVTGRLHISIDNERNIGKALTEEQ